ncbi:hypothetical protein MHH33_16140 [Paenisporosarcina sp. FSL H8-0542]|uniref:hypothetical protein n=1 Tax=Paenisporosarcina sp. FSL H8-0542 TaxID=2921401 RepID=UPI00315A9976
MEISITEFSISPHLIQISKKPLTDNVHIFSNRYPNELNSMWCIGMKVDVIVVGAGLAGSGDG